MTLDRLTPDILQRAYEIETKKEPYIYWDEPVITRGYFTNDYVKWLEQQVILLKGQVEFLGSWPSKSPPAEKAK